MVKLISEMKNPTTNQIFISYSRDSKNIAESIYQLLVEFGFSVWFDEADLIPGVEWNSAVSQVISDARLILVLIGSAEPGRWQTREIQSALQGHTAIREVLPILVETGGSAHTTSVAFRRHH